MSTHPIDRALNELKKRIASKPPGTYTLEECARKWGTSADQTKKHLKEMVDAKIAREIPGKKVNGSEQIVATVYYSFSLPAKIAAKKK
jgi:Fic family protein